MFSLMKKFTIVLILILVYIVYGSIVWYNDPMIQNEANEQNRLEKIITAIGYTILFNILSPIFFVVVGIYRYIRKYI